MLEGGRKSTKVGLPMGVTIGGDSVKSGSKTFFFSANVCEDITENWSARLDELDSIQKGNS